MRRGGVIVIPAFAVGRSQTLLHVLRELEESGSIPKVPVYLDSPMAVDALAVHRRHLPDLNLLSRQKHLRGVQLFQPETLHLSVTRDDSKKINQIDSGAIIISASGMAAGGRVLHHLQQRLPDPRNTVLLIGYQAEGTRGRSLQEGKPFLRMFGEEVPVNAHIARIEGFSGHADYEELLAWFLGFNRPPERTFLVHGEGGSATAFAGRISQTLRWDVTVPQEGDSAVLDF